MRVCPRCRSIYATKVQWCGIDNASLIDQPEDPLIGTELERYRIVDGLGLGGMGCVYRATHTFIEREYAIKVLFGDFAGDPKFRERFRREAKSISQIRHPNVVTVEDFGTTPEGLTFLAMEMVHGRTLERAIEEEAPFSPIRAAQIVRQIVAGLGAAHLLGFVHRDVKPSNIMLSQQDGIELVKILDFGAVSMRSVPVDQRLTSVGHIIGTPTYMAPEQSQDPNVGPPADLYAAGVILYEMLTGSPPFVGKGRAEVLIKHIMEEPPKAPPSRGLEKIVAALLEKQPQQRPQAASDVIRMIDALGLDLAIISDPPRQLQESMLTAEIPGRRPERRDFHSLPTRAQTPSTDPSQPADPAELPTPQGDQDLLGYDTFPSLDPNDPADWSQWAGDGRTEKSAAIDGADGEFGGPTIPADVSETEDIRNTQPTDMRSSFEEPELPGGPPVQIRDDGPTQVDFGLMQALQVPLVTSDDLPTGDLASYDDSLIPPPMPETDDVSLETAKTISDADEIFLKPPASSSHVATVRDSPVLDDAATGDLPPSPTLELSLPSSLTDVYEDSEESVSIKARVIPVHDSAIASPPVIEKPRVWALALIALVFLVSMVIGAVVLWKGTSRTERPVVNDSSAQSHAAPAP